MIKSWNVELFHVYILNRELIWTETKFTIASFIYLYKIFNYLYKLREEIWYAYWSNILSIDNLSNVHQEIHFK